MVYNNHRIDSDGLCYRALETQNIMQYRLSAIYFSKVCQLHIMTLTMFIEHNIIISYPWKTVWQKKGSQKLNLCRAKLSFDASNLSPASREAAGEHGCSRCTQCSVMLQLLFAATTAAVDCMLVTLVSYLINKLCLMFNTSLLVLNHGSLIFAIYDVYSIAIDHTILHLLLQLLSFSQKLTILQLSHIQYFC